MQGFLQVYHRYVGGQRRGEYRETFFRGNALAFGDEFAECGDRQRMGEGVAPFDVGMEHCQHRVGIRLAQGSQFFVKFDDPLRRIIALTVNDAVKDSLQPDLEILQKVKRIFPTASFS
ncbi:MAG: hypothetical protein HY028_06500 [Gammaproteobacteria bacterium]|nr:hypothetical protein [Gammaproteobacteria bacterium]